VTSRHGKSFGIGRPTNPPTSSSCQYSSKPIFKVERCLIRRGVGLGLGPSPWTHDPYHTINARGFQWSNQWVRVLSPTLDHVVTQTSMRPTPSTVKALGELTMQEIHLNFGKGVSAGFWHGKHIEARFIHTDVHFGEQRR
jgi:hypothetical protein